MSTELWKPHEKSDAAKRFYAEAGKHDLAKISLERILDSAKRSMGLSDFGEGEFMPALECLARSMNEEARLNAVGIKAAAGLIRLPLQNRLKVEAIKKKRPELFERGVPGPLFIIGGSRTGTTLLQRLLAQDPSNRALLAWEMTSPMALGNTDPQMTKQAIAAAQTAHQALHFLNPSMKAVHFSAATLPEECVLMMGGDGLNWGVLSNLFLPSYSAFLAKQEFTGAYRRHREFLQIFQRDSPPKRWVLKAPYHLPELRAILNVYPDARFIQTHRDMLETVTSTTSLFCTFRSTFSDQVDPVAAGAEQVELLSAWITRALDVRGALPENSKARFFDVKFKELAADPLGMLRRIYDYFGFEMTDETQRLMLEHLEGEKKQKHGKHKYTPEQFGLDVEAIREKFKFYEDWCGSLT